MEINKIYTGDCLEVLKGVESGSVDLTVTSPPYDNLRTYGGYTFDFEGTAKELYRVTKEGGVVVWVVGDETEDFSESGTSFRQALHFKQIGFNLLDTMIYVKQNYLPLINTARRYSGQFEYMFVFSKGRPNAFNPLQVEKVRNKVEKGGGTRNRDGSMGSTKVIVPKKETKDATNVWSYPTDKAKDAKDHPAVFPEQLANDHIISWSNEGDLVLDPMCGSGTTCKMALLNNRNYIGIELNPEYVKIAEARLISIKKRLL